MILYCRVENKKLVIPNQQAMTEYIASLDGKFVTVEIKKTVSKRSVKQNRLWWLYMGIISEYTGFTKDEAHEICKAHLCQRDKVNELTGEVFRVTKSTTEYNKTEFNELVSQLQQFAAERIGVFLPDPNSQLEINI